MCVFSSVTLAAHNPVVNMDLPDVSVVQAGNKYYMSSTTMHLSPGRPGWLQLLSGWETFRDIL